MIEAWKVLLAALFTIAGCYSAGLILLRWSRAKLDRVERVPLAFLSGAAAMHLAIFAVMALRIAYKPVLAIVVAGAIVWEALVWYRARHGIPHSRPVTHTGSKPHWGMRLLFVPTFAVYTVVYLANAWAPDTSADGAGYHLANIARYLRAHGFVRIATSMYSDLGQGVEMLYVPAFAFGRHSGPPLVHLAFLIALAVLIYAYGRRIGKPWVGAAAAAMVYVSPVLGRDATTSYIDVATGAIVFAAFYWLQVWDDQRHPRLLMVVGLLAGYAFTAKYTMFVMVPYALVFIAWRARRVRPVLIAAAAAAVMIAPWLIKNWVLVQNPVAPFATRLFPSPYFHTLVIEEWAAYLRRYEIPDLSSLPLEDTVRGLRTQGLIGPVFLLAPIALLALRDRIGRRLLLLGAILLATYFGNIGTRFLIPCLPFFALAMALPLDRWRVEMIAIVLIQAVGSWMSVVPRYASQYSWRLSEFPYEAALRIMPEQTYLRTHIQFDLIHAIEENTAPRDRIFALAGFERSYTSREIFDAFEGAENNLAFDFVNVARFEDFQPIRILKFQFPQQRADHIRLLETARAVQVPQQWNVHELRFYHHGVEIPRAVAWRLRAWPNPWEIQLAFDNSPVTRWRSWRAGEPGMFIEVNFGRAEDVDEIRMWTSRDWMWPMQFQVQTGGDGRWRTIADRYQETGEELVRFLGPDATQELYARGIRYLVVPDSDLSATDLADNPESWNLQRVTRANQAWLYKLVP